jgi:hypothetical protein
VRVAVIGIWAAFAASAVVAQERSPEVVASAYFEAIKAGDWNRVAAQFTPEAQAKYRAMMTELIDAAAASGQADVRSMLLGKDTTAEQAAKLSDRDFVARTLEAILGRSLGMIQFERIDVVGRVPEGDRLLHVLCRMHMAGPAGVAIEKMTVVSLERDASGWGIGLTGDIKGLVAALKAQLSAKPAAK